jgi:hypothetical protein
MNQLEPRENNSNWYSFFAESLDTAVSRLQMFHDKSNQADNSEVDELSDRDIAAMSALRSSLGESNTIFRISTANDGHNSGRIYYLRANSVPERDNFIKQLKSTSKSAAQKMLALTRFASPLALREISQQGRPDAARIIAQVPGLSEARPRLIRVYGAADDHVGSHHCGVPCFPTLLLFSLTLLFLSPYLSPLLSSLSSPSLSLSP